jgi:hypothetical protein
MKQLTREVQVGKYKSRMGARRRVQAALGVPPELPGFEDPSRSEA